MLFQPSIDKIYYQITIHPPLYDPIGINKFIQKCCPINKKRNQTKNYEGFTTDALYVTRLTKMVFACTIALIILFKTCKLKQYTFLKSSTKYQYILVLQV
mmetsp:Transcript_36537/g.85410  ORF Transcript_36537/g.85410 Transcript_36537/m.85410 type:complete len:100 (-) Transcript_36537:141-440(-)